MKIQYIFLAFFFVCACNSGPKDSVAVESSLEEDTAEVTSQTAEKQISLSSRYSEEEEPYPITTLRFKADSAEVVVTETGSCTPIEAKEFVEQGIPESAIDACRCWYAGGGHDYYIIEENDSVNIYRKVQDEMLALDETKWLWFKTVE